MKGFGRVVVGSIAGSLIGAAMFFAVDGLMPLAAEADPLANLTDLQRQDVAVNFAVWVNTCMALAGLIEEEDLTDNFFSDLEEPPLSLSEKQIIDSFTRVGAYAIQRAKRGTCPKEMF